MREKAELTIHQYSCALDCTLTIQRVGYSKDPYTHPLIIQSVIHKMELWDLIFFLANIETKHDTQTVGIKLGQMDEDCSKMIEDTISILEGDQVVIINVYHEQGTIAAKMGLCDIKKELLLSHRNLVEPKGVVAIGGMRRLFENACVLVNVSSYSFRYNHFQTMQDTSMSKEQDRVPSSNIQLTYYDSTFNDF
ncbi:hypothetical protein BC941DRAFT_472851 [Chlamydoabsidia padenii]|nr:hypothetical protein BC941DRAFT_472851 [Chlamydoabsidia padenii]